jgi:hypothetical protein
MFLIPGWLLALLTFPGIICHEIAHRFFCDVAGVPVYAVSYIRVRNPAGYVIHGPAENLKSAFLISIGPLIVNTLLCSLISFAAVIPIFLLEAADAGIVPRVLLWVGISIGMHAFPSDTDMKNFTALVQDTGTRGLPHFIGKFFSGLFRLANALRFFWFDFFYAFVVASLLPWLMLGLRPAVLSTAALLQQ